MNERLIVYSCHDDATKHSATMEHLRDFATEVAAISGRGTKIEVVDGNARFRQTRVFLRTAVSKASANGSCDFDFLRDHIRRRLRGGEMSDSLSGKVVIVSDTNVFSIVGSKAHGITEFKGQFCFLVKNYKNILWHEAAHLFGADDHYREDNQGARPECEHPDFCIMQWDPAGKPCAFCDQSKREIQKYLAERRVPRIRTARQKQRH
jgi:hypothetical protein